MNENLFFDPITDDDINGASGTRKAAGEELKVVEVKPNRHRTSMQYIDDFLMKDGYVQAAAMFRLVDGSCLAYTREFPTMTVAEILVIRDKIQNCRHVMGLKAAENDFSQPQLDIHLPSFNMVYLIRYADGHRGIITTAHRNITRSDVDAEAEAVPGSGKREGFPFAGFTACRTKERLIIGFHSHKTTPEACNYAVMLLGDYFTNFCNV